MSGLKSGIAILAFACLSISGCVSQQQIAVSPPIAPRPPQPLPPGVPITVHRVAIAAQTTRIDFAVALNPDCSVRAIPTTRLLDKPSHGTAQIATIEDFPTFAPQNIHAHCNLSRVRGTAITYLSNKDYSGPDNFTFEIIYDDGIDRTINVVMMVK